jgi:hypothetical protein
LKIYRVNDTPSQLQSSWVVAKKATQITEQKLQNTRFSVNMQIVLVDLDIANLDLKKAPGSLVWDELQANLDATEPDLADHLHPK